MLEIKEWTEPIWRVDKIKGELNKTIRNLYTLDKPTYFLTDPKYAQSYIDNYVRKNKSGKGKLFYYIKKFIPTGSTIRLIDMGKPDSIREILSWAAPEEGVAISTSFKIQANNSVKRVSEGEIKYMDDIALATICRLYDLDGYFIDAPGLHPEIGLCPAAFKKFVFDDQIERIEAATISGRKRTRNNIFKNKRNNNNNNNRTFKRIRF